MLKQLAQGVVKPMLKRRQVESCPALKPAQGPKKGHRNLGETVGAPQKKEVYIPQRTIQKVKSHPEKIVVF